MTVFIFSLFFSFDWHANVLAPYAGAATKEKICCIFNEINKIHIKIQSVLINANPLTLELPRSERTRNAIKKKILAKKHTTEKKNI